MKKLPNVYFQTDFRQWVAKKLLLAWRGGRGGAVIVVALLFLSFTLSAQTLSIAGLKQPVEVIRDRWGISHIYAQNEHDLFMAQGYVAASDRLFQLEIWRRQATGTVAHLLGKQELKRDIGTRLFKFRGNLTAEFNHYHPRSALIIKAFVAGINAYVREMRAQPDKLPFEFKVLNTLPDYWTPEVVISRHQGLLSNLTAELTNGRIVALIGAEKYRNLAWFHPAKNADEPLLDLDKSINPQALFQPILELYEAFRTPLKFNRETQKIGANLQQSEWDKWYDEEKANVGSNNWVISGKRSQRDYPMLANDPHRAQNVPSLRYWVHLNAPGWNVIGAGEPSLPGVSIGHNDVAAWGLTIFETDNEDLYVYQTNPQNPNQYKYQGKWENLKIIIDTIQVKGASPEFVQLKYTRHGPVLMEDANNQTLYAVRAGWLEVGCVPYLASLRMNQSKTWEEFRTACSYSRIPGENMVYADKNGNIGWQAVGISPIRKNWSGLVPVAGDGRYEWAGYLPIQQLPNKFNPSEGYIATANNNLTLPDFPHRNAIGWEWASPTRAHRIEEVLGASKRLNLQDFAALQTDYKSMTAQTLVGLLKNREKAIFAAETMQTAKMKEAYKWLSGWDFQLNPNSVAATIYTTWEAQMRQTLYNQLVPASIKPYFRTLSTKRLTDWLITPDTQLGADPIKTRDELMATALQKSLEEISKRLGEDMNQWQYGQAKNKHIAIKHALSDLVTEEQRAKINVGPLPRGGYGETVNNTGNLLNQTHGASFRIITDTENWDKTLGINSPGQSGNPDDPHYKDLFELWANDGYFPVYFSKPKIEAVADRKWILKP